jgi:ERCC4-type nuclease
MAGQKSKSMNVAQPTEPAVAQVYQTDRTGEHLQILYVDNEIVLLRCEDEGRNGNNGHRLERRVAFEKNVEAGHFKYKPDSNLDMIQFEEEDWSEVSYIGEKTAQNLHDAGFETNLDIQQADEAELLMVDGLGAQGLQNLIEFAR